MQEQLSEIRTRLERHEQDTRSRLERLSERQIRLESSYMEVTRRLENLEGLPTSLEQMNLTMHQNFSGITEMLGRLDERITTNKGGLSKTWGVFISVTMLVVGALLSYAFK